MTVGYRLVQYEDQFYSDGTPKLVTLRIEQAMAKLEEALGYTAGSLDLPQGCHHDGQLSGGTHSDADVFDLSYDHAEDKATAGLALGVYVFIRPYNWDKAGGMAHCHCLLAGSAHFSPEAAAQIPAWKAHRDGLADNAPYDPAYPWQADVPDFTYDPHWTRGQSGGGQTQGGTWPQSIAVTEALGGHHAIGVRVTERFAALIKAHPNAAEWKDLETRHIARQAEETTDHTHAYHLSHKGA